jgi:hypothetical protein
MADPNLANLSRPGAVAGRLPNVERPILLAVGRTSPTVIGLAVRVAAPRSLLGIVDQVQFAR